MTFVRRTIFFVASSLRPYIAWFICWFLSVSKTWCHDVNISKQYEVTKLLFNSKPEYSNMNRVMLKVLQLSPKKGWLTLVISSLFQFLVPELVSTLDIVLIIRTCLYILYPCLCILNPPSKNTKHHMKEAYTVTATIYCASRLILCSSFLHCATVERQGWMEWITVVNL